MFLDSHSFIGLRTNLEQKIKRDKINYNLSIEKGEAETTRSESGMIDYKQVIDYIIDFIEIHDLNVKAVCYDAWNAQSFVTTIESMHLDWLLLKWGKVLKRYRNRSKNLECGLQTKEYNIVIIHYLQQRSITLF